MIIVSGPSFLPANFPEPIWEVEPTLTLQQAVVAISFLTPFILTIFRSDLQSCFKDASAKLGCLMMTAFACFGFLVIIYVLWCNGAIYKWEKWMSILQPVAESCPEIHLKGKVRYLPWACESLRDLEVFWETSCIQQGHKIV